MELSEGQEQLNANADPSSQQVPSSKPQNVSRGGEARPDQKPKSRQSRAATQNQKEKKGESPEAPGKNVSFANDDYVNQVFEGDNSRKKAKKRQATAQINNELYNNNNMRQTSMVPFISLKQGVKLTEV